MIQLSYNLDASGIPDITVCRTLTDTDLDYRYFYGDIAFRVNGEIFDAPWGWVTVLDFATQFLLLSVEIKDGEKKVLEFTESDAVIELERLGDEVALTANYVVSKAIVSLRELQDASADFLHQLLKDLLQRSPNLRENPVFINRMELLKLRKQP